MRVYVPQIHVDLSSQFFEFLPESNRQPRDEQSLNLTNYVTLAREVTVTKQPSRTLTEMFLVSREQHSIVQANRVTRFLS